MQQRFDERSEIDSTAGWNPEPALRRREVRVLCRERVGRLPRGVVGDGIGAVAEGLGLLCIASGTEQARSAEQVGGPGAVECGVEGSERIFEPPGRVRPLRHQRIDEPRRRAGRPRRRTLGFENRDGAARAQPQRCARPGQSTADDEGVGHGRPLSVVRG